MLNISVLRWGKPYESLEKDNVVHFITGEPIASVSQANGALLQRDMRNAKNARKALLDFKPEELIARIKKAADLYLSGTLSIGDGTQSPDRVAADMAAAIEAVGNGRRVAAPPVGDFGRGELA